MSDETTRLRALLERATQTPWRQDGAEITVMGSTVGVDRGETVIAECTLPDCLEVADEDREEQEERNAALIVAAVNALPTLLDAAERAERAEARVRELEAAALLKGVAEGAALMHTVISGAVLSLATDDGLAMVLSALDAHREGRAVTLRMDLAADDAEVSRG